MTNTKTVRLHQIMPADGWFIRDNTDNKKPKITPLVAWGLTEEGVVVGLIIGDDLAICPVTDGCYMHQTDVDLLKPRMLSSQVLKR